MSEDSQEADKIYFDEYVHRPICGKYLTKLAQLQGLNRRFFGLELDYFLRKRLLNKMIGVKPVNDKQFKSATGKRKNMITDPRTIGAIFKFPKEIKNPLDIGNMVLTAIASCEKKAKENNINLDGHVGFVVGITMAEVDF